MKRNIGKKIAFGISILATTGIIVGGIVMANILKNGADTFYNVFVASGWEESWDESDGTVYENLRYDDNNGKNTKRNKYDLYIPKDADKTKPQGVILFVHGGSWMFGNKDAMDWAAARYAKEGYITATMSYNLISGNAPYLSYITGSPTNVTIYDMLDDVGNCIKAIKEELVQLGYNPTNLALSGMSSGSHISLLYGYSRAEESAIPISFMFEQTGPVDMHKIAWNPDNSAEGAQDAGIAGYVSMFSGKTVTEEDIVNSISPVAYINENSVPTLMGYAEKDDVIGTGHYPVIKEYLDKYNVTNDVVLYPNSGHMLESDKDSEKEWHEKTCQWLQTYFGY